MPKYSIKNIVIDCGHGGIDSNGKYTTAPRKMAKLSDGTISYEGVINREIGKKLGNLIKEVLQGINVIYTVNPNDPTDVSLSDRVKLANKYNPKDTIFISIHNNAFNGKARGFEIYTTKGETKSDILAEHICDAVETLYKEYGLPMRYDLVDGDKDKEAQFYVIKNTNCPAVLIECLFFDNLEDYKLLKDELFQNLLVNRIVMGIKKFIS